MGIHHTFARALSVNVALGALVACGAGAVSEGIGPAPSLGILQTPVELDELRARSLRPR